MGFLSAWSPSSNVPFYTVWDWLPFQAEGLRLSGVKGLPGATLVDLLTHASVTAAKHVTGGTLNCGALPV